VQIDVGFAHEVGDLPCDHLQILSGADDDPDRGPDEARDTRPDLALHQALEMLLPFKRRLVRERVVDGVGLVERVVRDHPVVEADELDGRVTFLHVSQPPSPANGVAFITRRPNSSRPKADGSPRRPATTLPPSRWKAFTVEAARAL